MERLEKYQKKLLNYTCQYYVHAGSFDNIDISLFITLFDIHEAEWKLGFIPEFLVEFIHVHVWILNLFFTRTYIYLLSRLLSTHEFCPLFVLVGLNWCYFHSSRTILMLSLLFIISIFVMLFCIHIHVPISAFLVEFVWLPYYVHVYI